MQWSEKYRPRTLDDVVFPDSTIEAAIRQWVDQPLDYPSLLLWGSTGTGKTTIAKVIQNELEERFDSMILYASIQNGVEDIRERILGFCEEGSFSEGKIVILDEADRLSTEAQNTLRNVMDKYERLVRFIFTANNVSRIADPVAGRCLSIEIVEPDREKFISRLAFVLESEDFEPDMELLEEITNRVYPSIRNAINELQKLSMGVASRGDTPNAIIEMADEYLRGAVPVQSLRDEVSGSTVQDIEKAFIIFFENIEDHVPPGKIEQAIIHLSSQMASLRRGVFPELAFVAAMVAIRMDS